MPDLTPEQQPGARMTPEHRRYYEALTPEARERVHWWWLAVQTRKDLEGAVPWTLVLAVIIHEAYEDPDSQYKPVVTRMWGNLQRAIDAGLFDGQTPALLLTLASWGNATALDALVSIPDEPRARAPRPVPSRAAEKRVAALTDDLVLDRFLRAARDMFGDQPFTAPQAVEHLTDYLPDLPERGNPNAHLGTWLRRRRNTTTSAGRRLDHIGKPWGYDVPEAERGRVHWRVIDTTNPITTKEA